jgi:hypothetical protein
MIKGGVYKARSVMSSSFKLAGVYTEQSEGLDNIIIHLDVSIVSKSNRCFIENQYLNKFDSIFL